MLRPLPRLRRPGGAAAPAGHRCPAPQRHPQRPVVVPGKPQPQPQPQPLRLQRDVPAGRQGVASAAAAAAAWAAGDDGDLDRLGWRRAAWTAVGVACIVALASGAAGRSAYSLLLPLVLPLVSLVAALRRESPPRPPGQQQQRRRRVRSRAAPAAPQPLGWGPRGGPAVGSSDEDDDYGEGDEEQEDAPRARPAELGGRACGAHSAAAAARGDAGCCTDAAHAAAATTVAAQAWPSSSSSPEASLSSGDAWRLPPLPPLFDLGGGAGGGSGGGGGGGGAAEDEGPVLKLPTDRDREAGRLFRRTVFFKRDWARHRSVKRYGRHIRGIFRSRIVRGLVPPLAYVLIMSSAVCCYESLLCSGKLHALAPGFPWPNLAAPHEGVFNISTFALSLLLVFRTNSSYERWWEAATAWNCLVSGCCHLARQAYQWLPGPGGSDDERRSAMLRWLRAFPLALTAHVREERAQLPRLLEGVLAPDELELALRSPQPAQLALSALGALIAGSRLTLDTKTHMDETLRRLQDCMDVCEKIIRTPLPLSYSRHTSRYLVCWLTALPFCVWTHLGWATVVVAVAMAFFLLGIEEIGVQVEEPLDLLALEHWNRVVGERLDQMEAEHAAVQRLAGLRPKPAPEAAQHQRHERPPPPQQQHQEARQAAGGEDEHGGSGGGPALPAFAA